MTATGLAFLSQDRWDLLVVGAGPAGSLTALLAARRGRRVLLVEKKAFPRPKPCGGCLNGAALGVLDRSGLIEPLIARGAIGLQGLDITARGRQLAVPLPGGASISRPVLDQLVVDCVIQSGGVFSDRTIARVEPLAAGGGTDCRRVRLEFPGGAEQFVEAEVVVVAAGLANHALDPVPGFLSRAHPRSHLGLSARTGVAPEQGGPPPGRIAMAVGREGYVGLVRDETGEVHLAAAVAPGLLQTAGTPGAAVGRLLRDAGTPLEVDLTRLAWMGTPALTRSSRQVADCRLFVVGDAAAYVEPFTGEGIAWALTGAELLAPIVEAGITDWHDSLALRWRRELTAASGRRKWLCRGLTAGLRSPLLVDLALRGLSSAPSLLAGLIRGLDSDPAGTRRLTARFERKAITSETPAVADSPFRKGAA